MRLLMVISTAVLLHHGRAQNFYLSESGPPGYPGPGNAPYNSHFGGPAPTTKPSRPSFFRNPLAAASNLHKTVIAGIRAPAFLSNLLPSASAPRPSIFSFAKPPRGFSGANSHPGPSAPVPSFASSYAPDAAANSNFNSFFGRPGSSSPGGSPGSSSFFAPSSPGPSPSPYAGLPSNVISALQNSQFDPSTLAGDQQEAATNVHEISGSPYDRSPPRIRPGFSSATDDSDISASAVVPSLAGTGSGTFDPSSYAPQGVSGLSSLQGSSGAAAAVAQTLLSQQASVGSSAAPSSIAGYDIGVPVQLGFQSHTADQTSSAGQQVSSIGPAYQIDTSSLQYPSSYQQPVSQGQTGQNAYSGLATGYGAVDTTKQQSSYGQGQSFVVGSSLSYDGKSGPTSYANSAKPADYSAQGGYTGYSTSGQAGSNEALVQALKAYANGNVKYVPGKPAVPINHQLQQSAGHSASTSYSTSSSSSSSLYAPPISAKSSKYSSSSSSTSYSPPVKSAVSYSNPVKSSSIRYSSNSGGLSYAESAPQAKYPQKSHFESTRTVGSSLKFGDNSSAVSSSSSASSSSAAAAAAKKKSS
ncbi:uncharacterized protein DDB_G0271670-like [Varroa destructor]|uniref:Uncharacterized protein n=1 Tax=Varroa destructor TaxID=109461 RepID=A0A7M7KZ88_VARDE|nr:uncharacterized protein DDB_G0271670-like [Varroa destructor]